MLCSEWCLSFLFQTQLEAEKEEEVKRLEQHYDNTLRTIGQGHTQAKITVSILTLWSWVAVLDSVRTWAIADKFIKVNSYKEVKGLEQQYDNILWSIGQGHTQAKVTMSILILWSWVVGLDSVGTC